MFKNYYLFKKQIEEITPKIKNAVIFSIFTVHKNEIIFDLRSEKNDLQLLINISPTRPYVFVSEPVNYKVSKYNMFDILHGQEIKSIKIIPNNKYIVLELNYHIIAAYFFGPKPNVIVLEKENESFVSSFKTIKKNEQFENIKSQISFSSPAKNEIAGIIKSFDGSINDLTRQIFPSANNKMVAEVAANLNLNSSSQLTERVTEDLIKELEDTYDQLDSGKAYIFRKEHHEMFLLLYKSKQLLNAGYAAEEFDSINKAWKIFNHQSEKALTIDKLYSQLSIAIHKRLKSLQAALKKLEEAEDIEKRKVISDLKGNLILTNKHKIPRGSAKVELINVFSDQQETVEIKLNPKKTSVENASYYFEKYKNISEKKQVVKIKKDAHIQELNEIEEISGLVENASIKELIKIKERLIGMNILQAELGKKKNPDSLKYSFKRLILENQWDVYIGKNGVNNDLLTFSFANKSDLWLHAQGVPGSHVIIKSPKSNNSIPKNIIEQAAQLAASNSKAQHSSTVPVIYTEVRYVSRIKKAEAGTVNVKNEKVVFVKPLNLN